MSQDLQRHRRADAGGEFEFVVHARGVAVHHLEGDAEAAFAARTGQNADDLESLRAALGDDFPPSHFHQLAIEFARSADHFGVGGHGGGDLAAGRGARLTQIARVAQARHGQRGVEKRRGEVGRGTAVGAERDPLAGESAHFGEAGQNVALNRMVGREVGVEGQSAHLGVGEHGGVFAGAVVEVGGRGDVVLDYEFQHGRVAG